MASRTGDAGRGEGDRPTLMSIATIRASDTAPAKAGA
jgi:hypothetical protein